MIGRIMPKRKGENNDIQTLHMKLRIEQHEPQIRSSSDITRVQTGKTKSAKVTYAGGDEL